METVMSRGVDQGNMLRHAEVLDTTALDSVSELMNFVINKSFVVIQLHGLLLFLHCQLFPPFYVFFELC